MRALQFLARGWTGANERYGLVDVSQLEKQSCLGPVALCHWFHIVCISSVSKAAAGTGAGATLPWLSSFWQLSLGHALDGHVWDGAQT